MKKALPYIFYTIGSATFIAMAISAFALWNTTNEVQRHVETLADAAQKLPLSGDHLYEQKNIGTDLPETAERATSAHAQQKPEADSPNRTTPFPPKTDPDDSFSAFPTGRLPQDIMPGTLKDELTEPQVIGPAEFNDLVALLHDNTIQARAKYGDNRILVSNWIDGIQGIGQPLVVWDPGKICPMENDQDNLTAIKTIDVGKEILVSGFLTYQSAITGNPTLMTKCRLHGYYHGGFRHALGDPE